MSETDVGEIGMTPFEPLGITPSQTVGPFFAFSLTPGGKYAFETLVGDDLVTDDTVGGAIRIEGRVYDGNGEPVPDTMVEIWQADGAGRYSGSIPPPNTTFKGFGRCGCDAGGGYAFRTVKPGLVAAPDGGRQAPHINVGVFARGVLRRMFTRIYFADEPANEGDPVLRLVAAERRATLLARRDGSVDGMPRYILDIRLQGENETVFFEA
ncbi:MAG: protocatechuate 3,4-dioxygenase subunit alpha [Bauldia sp.]